MNLFYAIVLFSLVSIAMQIFFCHMYLREIHKHLTGKQWTFMRGIQ